MGMLQLAVIIISDGFRGVLRVGRTEEFSADDFVVGDVESGAQHVCDSDLFMCVSVDSVM